MAIFGNFKGTTTSEFKIGKSSGSKISTGTQPSSDLSTGDLWIDANNSTLKIYNSGWKPVGESLSTLLVDNGTLSVDSANDTVSIGSTSSNERLFVNGNLRLGTNPSLQYSGAYLDLKHSNGSASVIRVVDNNSGNNPIFKVYNASNSSEVFKVDGSSITINNTYNLPTADGTAGQVIKTDGSGTLSFTDAGGVGGSTTQVQYNKSGVLSGDADFTFDDSTNTLQVTNLDVMGSFSHVEDYGSITQAANIVVDYGVVTVDDRQPTSHDSYTVAEANALTYINPGDMIFVSNETGGATMAFYDGTDWRRITDRAVISS
jgi:hypothetical protein